MVINHTNFSKSGGIHHLSQGSRAEGSKFSRRATFSGFKVSLKTTLATSRIINSISLLGRSVFNLSGAPRPRPKGQRIVILRVIHFVQGGTFGEGAPKRRLRVR